MIPVDREGVRWDAVVRSAVVGLVAALGLTAAASILLSLTQTPMRLEPSVGMLVAWLSVACAGFMAARRAQRRGWLHGALGACAFFIIALLLGSLIFDQPIALGPSLVRLFLALVFGAIGGMVALAF